jgi:hypothetical protein
MTQGTAGRRPRHSAAPQCRLVQQWLGRRLAIAATVLAFALAAMPALAGPGGLSGSAGGFGRTVRQVLMPQGSETTVASPAASVTATMPSAGAGTLLSALDENGSSPVAELTEQPSPEVDPSPTAEPTVTPEPVEAAEPTETGEPTETVEPSPMPEPTGTAPPVREVARDNHGAAVSEAARAHDGEGNHGEAVREVARDNHGRAVSEAAKEKTATDEGKPVSEVARDNHGASVREAAGGGTGEERRAGRGPQR